MSFKINKGFHSKTLKAVVFDLDGTLIRSTIDFHEMNQAVARTLLEHGLPKEILDKSGRVNESIVHAYAYFKTHDVEGWADAVEKDLNRVSSDVEMARVDGSKAVDGTFELLDHLRAKGIEAAILTRGSRNYTMSALKASGLDGLFHTVVCRDDHPLTEAKPNPIALQRVFGHLSLTSGQCMFIGDHETDYLCAKGAGTIFAAVLTGSHGADVWDRLRPDVVMDSIADLNQLMEGNK